RYGLQCTLDQETHDLLQRARALLAHQIPTGEIPPVLKRALALLVGHLEKQKHATTNQPRPSAGGEGDEAPSTNGTGAGPHGTETSLRYIPAAVKRAVLQRDGERCSFVSESGQRCTARRMLEFDHREPVACGGQATVENVHLVCRAHNQHAAERAFGAEFMERKRAKA